MLRPADAELVSRDTGLPGLRLALDPEAILESIAAACGRDDLARCEVRYVRYKPATSCVVRALLYVGRDGDAAPIDLHVVAYRPDDVVKRDKALAQPAVASPLGPGRLSLPLGCVASVFPNDAQVRSLWQAGSPGDWRALLHRTFGDRRPELIDAVPTLLAYKPHRRAVFRLDLAGEPAGVLKLYGREGYAAARRNSRGFRSRGNLRVARRMGASDSLQAIGFKWIRGDGLVDLLSGDGATEPAMRLLAAALRELHVQPPPPEKKAAAGTFADRIEASRRAVGQLCPALAAAADRMASRIAGGIGCRPDRQIATIHGDFYAKQVLIGREEMIGLIDFDESTAGDPEADLGNFAAHLAWHVESGRFRADRAEVAAAELIDAYAAIEPGVLDRDLLRHYTAASGFQLVPRPFRDRLDNWPDRMAAMLRRVESTLGPAGTSGPGTHE